MKKIKILGLLLIFMLSACSKELEGTEKILNDSPDWSCDRESCTYDPFILWNTTEYIIEDNVFEIELRTEIDGVYGKAVYNYDTSYIEITDYTSSNLVFTCTDDNFEGCNISGEPQSQLQSSLDVIYDAVNQIE